MLLSSFTCLYHDYCPPKKNTQNFQLQQKLYAEGAKKDLKEIMYREIQEVHEVQDRETETELPRALPLMIFSVYSVLTMCLSTFHFS